MPFSSKEKNKEEEETEKNDETISLDIDRLLTTCIWILHFVIEFLTSPGRLPLPVLFITGTLHPNCDRLNNTLKECVRKGTVGDRAAIKSAVRHITKAAKALAKIKMVQEEGEEREVDGRSQIDEIVDQQYKCVEELENAYSQLESLIPNDITFDK